MIAKPAPYFAPDPTPQQIANGVELGFDAYDLPGDTKLWALSKESYLASPSTIHDEKYLEGGTLAEREIVDANFTRDCRIVIWCRAESYFDRQEHLFLMAACAGIITIARQLNDFWSATSRNNDITRMQGGAFMVEAMRDVNACAAYLIRAQVQTDFEFPAVPYPEAV